MFQFVNASLRRSSGPGLVAEAEVVLVRRRFHVHPKRPAVILNRTPRKIFSDHVPGQIRHRESPADPCVLLHAASQS